MARNEQRARSDNVRSGARSVRNSRLTLFDRLAALAYYLLILWPSVLDRRIAMFQAARRCSSSTRGASTALLWGGTFSVSIWSPA